LEIDAIEIAKGSVAQEKVSSGRILARETCSGGARSNGQSALNLAAAPISEPKKKLLPP
jgi:hypothetical protein